MRGGFIRKRQMRTNQFDRYATSYSKNREIQDEIAQKLLLAANANRYKKILDIGCGDGALFEKIQKTDGLFVGVDASPKMCELHRKRANCIVVDANFDDPSFAKQLEDKFGKFDLILSSSALQWSKDLKALTIKISTLSDNFAIALFTSGSFASLYNFLGLKTFLPTIEDVKDAFTPFYISNFEICNFKKSFINPKDAMRYIKQTGVSHGGLQIEYSKAKELYDKGPKELEFEAICLVGSFKNVF